MNRFREEEQEFIRELALTAKMEEEEVIENLLTEKNLKESKTFTGKELSTDRKSVV